MVETWNGDHPSVTGKHAALYVQDRWTLNDRITLEPGLRAEFNRGIDPRRGVRLHDVSRGAPPGRGVGSHRDPVDGPAGPLRKVLRSALHRRLFCTSSRVCTAPISFTASRTDRYTELFRYTEESSVPPSSTFSQSHVDQWVLSVERAVGPNTTVQLQYVNRRFGDLIGWVDPRIDEWIPYQVRDPGPDGIPGTSTTAGCSRSTRATPVNRTLLLSNPPGAYRQYNGVQLIATRRFADRWHYQVSYSWSRSNGTVDDVYGTNATYWSMNPNGYGANKNVKARGAVPPTFDYSEFKAIGSYRPPWLGGFTTGMAFRWHNGTRWQRSAFVTDPIRIGFPAEPIGSRTTPSIGGLDLRGGEDVRPAARQPARSVRRFVQRHERRTCHRLRLRLGARLREGHDMDGSARGADRAEVLVLRRTSSAMYLTCIHRANAAMNPLASSARTMPVQSTNHQSRIQR